uniref:coiled-coil domain-containing protein 57 n=1 Tax=Ciona intestinalis TaxID=7719 RepID=UPI000180BB99|nr:coiled-coil domain-containing protein 57 [Ciona intestinalis]|eukprot:XP_026694466.1 coiled-coil domain-containing protein 57 [Ciona intestinalis]
MDLKAIELIALEKEKEWKSALSFQVTTLQEVLNSKTVEYDTLFEKFNQLKADFKYNLRLLHDRDKELALLDKDHNRVKVLEQTCLVELSEQKIRVEKLKEKLQNENKAREQLDDHYKKRILNQQLQMEKLKTTKSNENRETTNELKKVKIQFEQNVQSLKGEIESQRLEFMSEFEDILNTQESKFTKQLEETKIENSTLLMKHKVLSKEMEILQSKHDDQRQKNEESRLKVEELKSKLQKAEWNICDVSSIKNDRILELEAQVEHLKVLSTTSRDEFIEQRNKLDKEVNEKHIKLIALKQLNLDREKSFVDQFRKLQSQHESTKLELERAIWSKTEVKQQFKQTLSEKQEEVVTLQRKLEAATVQRKLASEESKKHEQFSKTTQTKTHMNIFPNAMGNREDIHSEHSHNQRCFTCEASLQKANELELQNQQLKSVIRQMTSELHEIAENKKNTPVGFNEAPTRDFPSHDNGSYVKSLENELLFVKREKRLLEEKCERLSGLEQKKEIEKTVADVSSDHPCVQSHIGSLNKTISDLHAEKLELKSEVQKLNLQVNHHRLVSQQHENAGKELSQKLQQVEVELTAMKHKGHKEAMNLRSKISDLTLQFNEAKRESDEFYRKGIHDNLEVTKLRNQISEMSLAFAAKTPWTLETSQAPLVQSLSTENTQLKAQLAAKSHALELSPKKLDNLTNTQLRVKLKQAQGQISSLVQEKSRLLELGNRLRLKLRGFQENNDDDENKQPNKSTIEKERREFQKKEEKEKREKESRLKEMENLQYDLTKQQLAFAQRKQIPTRDVTTEQSGSDVAMTTKQSMPSSVNTSINDVFRILDQAPSSPSIAGENGYMW